jgi:DNA-binding response OmpR family regulator
VEDDTAVRNEIAIFLKRRVAKLVTVMNGEEELEKFRGDWPDLVVTDIQMLVMSRLKTARLMRDEYRRVLIIVTTAQSDIANMLEDINIGVDQYVRRQGRLGAAGKLYQRAYRCPIQPQLLS